MSADLAPVLQLIASFNEVELGRIDALARAMRPDNDSEMHAPLKWELGGALGDMVGGLSIDRVAWRTHAGETAPRLRITLSVSWSEETGYDWEVVGLSLLQRGFTHELGAADIELTPIEQDIVKEYASEGEACFEALREDAGMRGAP